MMPVSPAAEEAIWQRGHLGGLNSPSVFGNSPIDQQWINYPLVETDGTAVHQAPSDREPVEVEGARK